MARLPELLPEDPALATVFADAMAEAYVGAVNGNDGRAEREERVEGDMTQEEAEKLYEEIMAK